jgi:hypothetical protein
MERGEEMRGSFGRMRVRSCAMSVDGEEYVWK